MLESLLTVLVILVVAAASAMLVKTSLEKKQEQKKRSEILKLQASKVEGNFRSVFMDNNIDAVKSKLGGNFSLFLRGNPYRIDGVKEALKWYKEAMTELQTMSVHNQSTLLLSDDVALVTFTFSGKGLRADKPFEGTGKTTRIWKHDKMKGWMLVHEHTSYN